MLVPLPLVFSSLQLPDPVPLPPPLFKSMFNFVFLPLVVVEGVEFEPVPTSEETPSFSSS